MSVTQFINGSLNITGDYLKNGSPSIYSVTGPTGPSINSFTASNFDAFQRLRVSNPFTLFDSSMIYKDNAKFDTYCTGTSSTGTFNTNQSTMFLTVGSESGSEVLRQTYRVFPYQPGKSLLTMNSFVMNAATLNLTQRVGYFNSQNGFFIELADSNVYLVQRSYVTGSVVETRVLQSNWNIDAFDGNGPSGIVLDLAKTQIFISDFEWLGVGTVRCGFVIGGTIYYAHYFNHANITTSTYITTASLPVSYQIKTTGVTSGGYTLKQICSTVLSEGGYQASSLFNTKGTNLTAITVAARPTITPIISIRIKSGRPCAIVIPAELELLVTTADTIQLFLIVNGTLNSSSYVSYGANSNVETDQTATTITGGTILQQGFCTSSSQVKQNISISSPEAFNFQLGVSIAGVSDVVTLCASNLTGTSDVLGYLGWYELN